MTNNDMYEHAPQRSPLATAAVISGVLSLLTCYMFYLALPFGALAVLFAILSRTETRMSGKGKIGITCGVIGMIATVIITVSACYYVLSTPEGRTYFEEYYRLYMGDPDFDLEEELGDLFPFITESGSAPSDNSDVPDSRTESDNLTEQETPDTPDNLTESEMTDNPTEPKTPTAPKTPSQKEGVFL